MRTATLLIFLALVGLGCGTGSYTAQLGEQAVTTTSMPVSSPLGRPLVLVVSPAAVPSDVQIENSRHALAGFNAFVGKSLSQAVAPYFSSVLVVASAEEAPADPHYVADVKLTRVVAKPLSAGGLTYTTLVMEWSLGLRPSEATDYVFSLVAESPSDMQYRTLDDGAKQMMKAAINGFQTQWSEKDVFNHLRQFEAAAAQPAADATTDI